MKIKSLKSRQDSLAQTEKQLEILNGGIFEDGTLPTFKEKVKNSNIQQVRPKGLEILQINVGYMCNQVCSHCHVDAGPDRKEIMTQETMEQILQVLRNSKINTVDLTGGAPEMHPQFRWFVEKIRKTEVEEIIVRSNLTIILANKKYNDLPEFFAEHKIHVISSLPFYKRNKTDRQRGDGVFDSSIKALQMLNAVGFGLPNSELQLDLVYNPSGAFLPGDQKALELDFKKALDEDFNIKFNLLFTITNLPISRFLDYLIASENYEEYMHALVDAFNPSAVGNVMCTNTISVSWEGFLFDCDFNQMLDLKVDSTIAHISEFNSTALDDRKIRLSQHCYGCTAGAGSSCQGSIA
ncbi:MAG: arsenosugar biosynthesis radical SAM protein ArsS [Flavobacteriaceae bacterium]|jgi:radical SAM/Cys-rich protein|nr:arsenosugar biosynthesis radical SAM protein ArsS [Flavobacteriaceae bacterium]MDO7591188.1 arsenosugar biosynthesis radical SAM protein ArsS [Flavobacteriaceae bacterium]MDO7598753.1 arsenosugar biosynthesis radical SAM protein ArsS [Flavobacteriaceae bacterium]MDO7602661.1 arsenosugar biosynthesis radical SAM protein ArsS [Flavobacteriaceae bacterium]